MGFMLDDADYFFIGIFFVNVILYSWMHFRRSSGKAMNDIKYGSRVAMVTYIVFIMIFTITIVGIWVAIFGS